MTKSEGEHLASRPQRRTRWGNPKTTLRLVATESQWLKREAWDVYGVCPARFVEGLIQEYRRRGEPLRLDSLKREE
jgi:hypothetical protein